MLFSFNGWCFIAFIIVLLSCGVYIWRKEGGERAPYMWECDGIHVYVYECGHHVCMEAHERRLHMHHARMGEQMYCMHPHMPSDE